MRPADIEKLLKKIERRLKRSMMSRLVVPTKDFCVFASPWWRVGIRRMVKKGERKGILILSMGWVALTVRF